MDRTLSQRVWQRARGICEYCRMPQAHDSLTFEVEHIISQGKHGGRSALSNLALACFADNRYKGSDIAGRDAKTGKLAPLFHPRRHRWDYHFRWNGAVLVGRTAIGRVTVALLRINLPYRVDLRQELIDEGLFPASLTIDARALLRAGFCRMPRTRKPSLSAEAPQTGKQQMERLIAAVEAVSGQIEVLRNALDDILVEFQWHVRNYQNHTRSLIEEVVPNRLPADAPPAQGDEPSQPIPDTNQASASCVTALPAPGPRQTDLWGAADE